MKQDLLSFKKPKLVLQVFQKIIIYHQEQKSFETRKEQSEWKGSIDSNSGFLEKDCLVLSKEHNFEKLQSSDLIILNDYNNPVYSPEGSVQFSNIKGSKFKFGIFQLRNFREEIEIHLEYSHFSVGVPKRENFKLCNLNVGVPTEIKINGKLDHSLSSGRDRMFREQHFIFHLQENIKEVEFCREPFGPFSKTIPKPEKVVDLMKDLW